MRNAPARRLFAASPGALALFDAERRLERSLWRVEHDGVCHQKVRAQEADDDFDGRCLSQRGRLING
eukprot:scaffold6711_cov118-Isochrysis_galbana.AAC.14